MEQAIAAYLFRIAPGKKRAEWRQKSLKRTLTQLEVNRPEIHDVAVTERLFSGAVGVSVRGSGTGQYGYLSDYEFSLNLDAEFLTGVSSAESKCRTFAEVWVEKLEDVIESDQKVSPLTAREVGVLYSHRHPTRDEAKAADALGIDIETFRREVDQVEEKIGRTDETLPIEDTLHNESRSEWEGGKYPAPLTVIDRVDERRLPVRARTSMPSRALHEYSLETLIRDDRLTD